jgi:hypothetical protein
LNVTVQIGREHLRVEGDNVKPRTHMKEKASAEDRDTILRTLECAENRVVAASFVLAKIVSVTALLVALLLLEGGVVKRIWEAEFRPERLPVHTVFPLSRRGDGTPPFNEDQPPCPALRSLAH